MFFKKSISAILILLVWTPLCSQAETVMFNGAGNQLSAHYLSPKTRSKPKGVIVFVHGDGALPYDAEGYYRPIWDHLRRLGYAIFSWDKPGVGRSTGNWLEQSMLDRQDEVHAAIDHLQEVYGYQGKSIGLIGFSQAGWVVPAVASSNPNVSFVIGIGFAIDWVSQSEYLTRTRLDQQQASKEGVRQKILVYQREVELIAGDGSYQSYLKEIEPPKKVMSGKRFEFIRKNIRSNALNDYEGINQPVLILLGEHDLNVDGKDTALQLTELFSERSNLTLRIIADANHGLLKRSHFNEQDPGVWYWLKMMWMEEDAFARDFLPTLSEWLENL
ncbi:MAG: alpha/beta fold hydrolase [Pseudomonadales bacterium]|nr:alpha/beta fold hydrolase [Pseudomonadales bacterium]